MPEIKKHKRGDVREDGMVFWCVQHGKPRWVTQKKYTSLKEQAALLRRGKRNLFKVHPRLLNKGDRREKDNKIFWGYNISSHNFEDWVSPEKYHERNTYIRVYQHKPNIKSYKAAHAKRPQSKISKHTYEKCRIQKDPLFKLCVRTRTRIWQAFNKKGYSHNSSTFSILGCSYKDFVSHITSLFTEGMSLDNYGEWHLDHILPVAAATTEEEVIALNHYTNFQPLWGSDNCSKKAKHCPKELKEYLNKMIEVV